MKRVVPVLLALLALALPLSGCSSSTLLPSSTLITAPPTPTPLPEPTAAPLTAGSNGFDHGAGNCLDAANRAIALIAQAASGDFGSYSFTMDMRLLLQPYSPASGCDAPSSRIQHYRDTVSAANLTAWPLDTTWLSVGQDTRQQWLADVLATLLRLYPHANITIRVVDITTGSLCGTASVGPGVAGARQIDGTCL